MSAKSDNDNHSNQLNPNNDEYWNSRDAGGSYADDDDDDVSFKRTFSQNISSPIKDEWTVRNYYFAQ
jgi:hypothetical protein